MLHVLSVWCAKCSLSLCYHLTGPTSNKADDKKMTPVSSPPLVQACQACQHITTSIYHTEAPLSSMLSLNPFLPLYALSHRFNCLAVQHNAAIICDWQAWLGSCNKHPHCLSFFYCAKPRAHSERQAWRAPALCHLSAKVNEKHGSGKISSVLEWVSIKYPVLLHSCISLHTLSPLPVYPLLHPSHFQGFTSPLHPKPCLTPPSSTPHISSITSLLKVCL